MNNDQKHWKLFYDTTKALFVLNDMLAQRYNWYYQELYYIKLVSFIDESIKYIEDLKASIGNSDLFVEWLDCVREGIDTILSNISEDELVFIHYRRTRAAHMFQDGYEFDPSKPKKTIVRIRLTNDETKSYTYVETNQCINRVESCYKRSDELDQDFDQRLFLVLTNIRKDLNRIYNKMMASYAIHD